MQELTVQKIDGLTTFNNEEVTVSIFQQEKEAENFAKKLVVAIFNSKIPNVNIIY